MARKILKKAQNSKETKEIALEFLEQLLDNKNSKAGVVGLVGDLGAGKTFFTQVVSKALGVKGRISSPTFVIMKKYAIKHPKYSQIFHIDAYRLKNEKELLHLGWEEIVKNKKHLIFIEWPERVKRIMPKHAKYVYISHDKGEARVLELSI